VQYIGGACKKIFEIGCDCVIGKLLISGNNCLISWKGPECGALEAYNE
jgi:hypothetical protein